MNTARGLTEHQRTVIIEAMRRVYEGTSQMELSVPNEWFPHYLLQCNEHNVRMYVPQKTGEIFLASTKNYRATYLGEWFYDLLAPSEEEVELLSIEIPELADAAKFYAKVVRGELC